MVLDRKKVMKNKSKTVVDPQENDHLSRSKRSSNGVTLVKSRIKEMGPICKSRKKYEKASPMSKQEEEDDEDFDCLFGQVNQHESVWLSSESFSPLYKGGDYSIDERLISFLTSNRGIHFFDGFNATNPIKEEDSLESTNGSCIESSSTSLSKCSESSSLFWDLDRTDLWVSLINLDGEDCKWISNVESDSENLESNFPSPTYNRSSDVYSSDADVSSSMISSFHDELSSELLSGSLDLDEMDFDEPLMWPFDEKYDWSHMSDLDFFCQSPRRVLSSSTAFLKNDGKKFVGFRRGSRRIVIANRNTKLNRSSSRNSMKMMLSSSKVRKKHKFGKGNFVMSAKRLQAMSLIGIDEFSKFSTTSHEDSSTTTKSESHSSTSSVDFDRAGLWVSLIDLNEEDSQWYSEEGLTNFPSPSYKNKINQRGFSFRDELSIEILSDEMDADEPLFWPYAKEQNWRMAWDSFSTSPRRDGYRVFGNPVSIRVRIHDQRVGFKKSIVAISGLSASKISGFKRGYGKKGNARKAKAMNSRKLKRNVAGKMDVIMENDVEGVAVEKILGLDEFDGHEGLDVEFHTDSFSILNE